MVRTELSIIIVDYKSSNYTISLISNLLKNLSGINYEIIVVDNDPSGNADQVISNKFAGNKLIKVIKSEKNAGFGAGNNLGAKSAQGDYLLLLNPDTEVCENAIEKMIDFLLKHSEIGALTPLIIQADGKSYQRHFFGKFQNFSSLLLRNQSGVIKKDPPEFFYSEMITAAALMVRKDFFDKIGGFDEKIFMYLEDEDLCRQLSKIGLKNAVLTTAKIIHFEGKSSTSFEKKKFYYKSQDYYWQKHYGTFKTFVMKIIRAPYIWIQKIKN